MKIDDGILEAEEENSPESPILLHSNRIAQPVDESNISESFPTLAYIDNLLPQSYQSNNYLQSSYNVNQPLIQKLSTFSEEEGVSSTQNWMSSLSKALKLRSTEHFSEKSLSKSELISILVYWGIRVRAKHLKADLFKKVSEIIDTIRKGGTTCYSHKIDERIRDSISRCEKQPSCCNHRIQCCKCSKWRKVPTSIAVESLPDMWMCSLNTWDLSMAKCAYPQEQDDAIREDRSDNKGEGIAQKNLTEEVEDYDPTKKKIHQQPKRHNIRSLQKKLPELRPACQADLAPLTEKRREGGSNFPTVDNKIPDVVDESLSRELWNPQNWSPTSVVDCAVDWVACSAEDRDICNASSFDPHTYHRLKFQGAKRWLNYDPQQDPNRLMKRAKMQSINIGDAISAQRRQFGQSVRREEGTELLTIPDTVARYKTVTLVNISDQHLGIVFAKCEEEGAESCLCIQELHADLLDKDLMNVLHCGDRLVSINSHPVALWSIDHQLHAIQSSGRPICLGFTPSPSVVVV
eukprot:gene23073-31390_t